MRTPEEILDYHMHQMGKHIVGLHESDLYECAINAIKEALTIPVVVSSACSDYQEGINMQCAKCDHPKYEHTF